MFPVPFSSAAEPEDFRIEAARASYGLVPSPEQLDIQDVDHSLCLATGNPRKLLRRQKWFTIVCAILGIGGVAVGGLIAGWQKGVPRDQRENRWMAVAVPASVGGMVCMFAPVTFGRLLLRRYLGDRVDVLRRSPAFGKPVYVELEDLQTFSKLKAAPEDLGYIAIDSINRVIVIEGVIFRYFVQAEDVIQLDVASGPGNAGVKMTFRIDDSVQLAVVVNHFSFWSEVLRQITGKVRSPLLNQIQKMMNTTAD